VNEATKMTDDQKWAVNFYLSQMKGYNKNIAKGIGRAALMAFGVAWCGYWGYQTIDASKDSFQAPEFQDVQDLRQAKETITSYTGSAPETALNEALALVEKSHEANPGRYYELDFLGIEQHIPYYVEDVAGMTDPKKYQPELKGLVSEIDDLAKAEYNTEAGIALAAMGAIMLVGFGGLFAGGEYRRSVRDVKRLSKEKKEFQLRWR
jgi:hypothetical protein